MVLIVFELLLTSLHAPKIVQQLQIKREHTKYLYYIKSYIYVHYIITHAFLLFLLRFLFGLLAAKVRSTACSCSSHSFLCASIIFS